MSEQQTMRNPMNCWRCSGTGQSWEYDWSLRVMRDAVCPNCDGTGRDSLVRSIDRLGEYRGTPLWLNLLTALIAFVFTTLLIWGLHYHP